jgi:predicted ATPase/DNA-binding winged helix-turn-helix (wHTH) protein
MNRKALKDDPPMDEETFAFGSFRLIPAQRMLLEDGKPLRLGSRALDILVMLVESAGKTIGKDELIARTWPDTVVDEGALRVHVAALRKALGDGRAGRRYVANIPGRGYSFVAPVTREQQQPATLPPDGAAAGGNLPAPLTHVVGRDDTIAALATQLGRRRFLTIVGPGGIGKTTVAIAVAETVRASYRDGVWFVGLATLADPDLVPSALGAVLGISLPGDNPLSGLTARLRDKHALIVIDSCEHVIGAAAALAEAVLKTAPRVDILATTREPLRAESEWLHRLAPLELPPQAAAPPTAVEAMRYSAVELFSERATATVDGFIFDDADVPALLEICRRLDGVPLALELAAARVDAFGLKGLAARLDDRFGVLTKGRRTALPRHQTLRAAMDWSYDLLPEIEQVVFRRLAVFRGSFSMEAAAAVAADERMKGANVIETLANLAGKSLIITDISGGITHHRLLDTTRSYAFDKLTDSGEAEQAARRHAEFFRDVIAPEVSGSQLQQPAIVDMTLYGREIDNVRAALDWAFSPVGDPSIGVVLTAAYVPVWLNLALIAECAERTERALDSLEHDLNLSARLRMRLHIAFGDALLHSTGFVERTGTVLAKALETAESLDDTVSLLRALWAMWSYRFNIGDNRAAQPLADRFSDVARLSGDAADVLVGDRLIGNTLHHSGNQSQARYHLQRVLDRYVAPSDQRHTMWFHHDQRVMANTVLARALLLQGLLDQAIQNAKTSLEDAQAADHILSICYALGEAVCPIALMTGDLAAAERSVAMLNDLVTKHNVTVYMTLGPGLGGELLIRRGEFSAGSNQLRAALHGSTTWGVKRRNSWFLGVLAEGLAGAEHLTDAFATIGQALAQSDRSGQHWCIAELHRVKGELLLQKSEDQLILRAEDCFRRALETAEEQGALFWELRAALSLARLRIRQDRRDDARQILAPVYDRFTEGLETADLKQARALLERLA